MFKYAVLLVVVICSVRSQRPWHAGTSGRLPMVLPQYLDERAAAEQAAQAGQTLQPGQTFQPGQTLQPGQFTPTVQTFLGGQPAQGTPVTTGATYGVPSVVNRLGENGASNSIPATTVPSLSTTAQQPLTSVPVDLPIDAHGDIDLVNRIMTWPRDKQPFWFINWQAIQAHRGDTGTNAQSVQPQPNPRSFFAG